VTLRVVLDSNVIVSGLGWSGPPARIVDAALDGRLELLTSRALLTELRRVLAYPKLAKVIDSAEQLVDLVEASSVVVHPVGVLEVVDDESDNRVLEAAVEGAADYIVSGDAHLLGLGSFQGIPIMAPGQFVAAVMTR
jgi:putative PIN family toxin of toxin-antitoxin system